VNNFKDACKKRITFYDFVIDILGVRPGVWLAGGAIRSLFDNTEIEDYDLFFSDYRLYIDTFARLISIHGFEIKFICPEGKLITLKNKAGVKVQLITAQFYQSEVQLINTFDFSVTQFATDGETIFVGSTSIQDAENKVLRLENLSYPVATINRLFKYKKKGYNIGEAIRQIVDTLQENPEVEYDIRLYID
jgi:hypothetical protein